MAEADPRILGTGDTAAAAGLIRAGAVLAVPTDTVYGLVCDPDDAGAVERIYAIKRRPAELELGILGADLRSLGRHGRLEGIARRLADRFWPGALSLIVPVAPGWTHAAPRGVSVSLRIPDQDDLLSVLRVAGPLASTSANRHGHPAARVWSDCLPLLDDGVDAILAGPPAAGRPSTIIECTGVPPRVLRAGAVSVEALRPYLGG